MTGNQKTFKPQLSPALCVTLGKSFHPSEPRGAVCQGRFAIAPSEGGRKEGPHKYVGEFYKRALSVRRIPTISFFVSHLLS